MIIKVLYWLSTLVVSSFAICIIGRDLPEARTHKKPGLARGFRAANSQLFTAGKQPRHISKLAGAFNKQDKLRNLRSAGCLALVCYIVVACGGGGGGSGDVIQVFDQGAQTTYHGADAGDINNDGLADIVVASFFSNPSANIAQPSLRVFYNNLDNPGSFSAPVIVPLNTQITYLKLADLTGDGLPDVVGSARFGDDEIVVLLNDPASPGMLGQERAYPSVNYPFVTDTADMNDDGLIDIVVAGGAIFPDSVAEVAIHFQGSSGVFDPLQVVGPGYEGVAIGDLDQDGLPDIVTPRPELESPSQLDADFLVGNDLFVYTQQPSSPGTFSGPRLVSNAGDSLSPVAIGDLNDDGTPDIAVGSRDGDGYWRPVIQSTVAPLQFSPGPRQTFTGTNINLLEIADLNRDGLADVIAASATGGEPKRIHIYLQSTGGTFNGALASYVLPDTTVNTPQLEVFAVSAADLNGDQWLDLVATNEELFVLFQNPSVPGTFGAPVKLAAIRQ